MGYGKMNKIIYEDNHLLVVEKPRNMLVQEDSTKDLDLLSSLKSYIKENIINLGMFIWDLFID